MPFGIQLAFAVPYRLRDTVTDSLVSAQVFASDLKLHLKDRLSRCSPEGLPLKQVLSVRKDRGRAVSHGQFRTRRIASRGSGRSRSAYFLTRSQPDVFAVAQLAWFGDVVATGRCRLDNWRASRQVEGAVSLAFECPGGAESDGSLAAVSPQVGAVT